MTLTAGAAEKVRGLMASEPAGEAEVLRVAIQGGGCSGFSTRSASTGARRPATMARVLGVAVVIALLGGSCLEASTFAFLDGLEESGFKIHNPNAVSACGCGHSFQVAEGEEAPEAAADSCGGCGHSH